MDREIYKRDLEEARRELDDLLKHRQEVDGRIAIVRQNIGYLAPLAGEWGALMDFLRVAKREVVARNKREGLGLKGSCLEVLRAADGPLRPGEVRERVEGLGHKSSVASVQKTLSRMAENGEAEERPKDGKKAYIVAGR